MIKKVIVIIISVGCYLILSLSAQTWTGAKRLTWSSHDSYVSMIAVDSNDIIHIVWSDFMYGYSSREIRYKQSTDGGNSWSAPKRLTWNSLHDWFPSMVIDSNDNIHIVWQQGALMLGGTPNEVYYKNSTDGGSSWSLLKRLTWNPGYSKFPRIAVDSNNHLHVVWRDDTPGSYELFYKKSTDGGATWGSVKRLTWMHGGDWLEYEPPDIATDSNNHIYIVWHQGGEVILKKSTDGGSSWSKPLRISGYSDYIFQQGPSLDVDSNDNIHIVWYDDKDSFANNEIYYKRSTDGGANWDGCKRLVWTAGDSYRPYVFTDSNNYVHILWYDDTPGNEEIFYKRSTNTGISWAGARRLTWSSGDSNSPVGAVDSILKIHIVWDDNSVNQYNYEIYYKQGIQ